MTTHTDMVYALGGVPVLGQLPLYANSKTRNLQPKYYFVDGNNGDDGNRGLKPTKAFATIEKAITTTNNRISWSDSPWANNDVIVIAPGTYAENLTAMPHGVHMVGMGNGGWGGDEEMGVKIKPASGIPIAGSWVNGIMQNITMESPDTSVVFDGTTVNKVAFINCRFAGLPGASPTTTDGFVSTGSSNLRFTNCQFLDLIDGLEFEGAAVGVLIEDCIIYASTVGIHLTNGQLASYSCFRNTYIASAGNTALATGIEANNCNPKMHSVFITATDPISGTVKCENCWGNGSELSGAGA